MKTKIMDTKKLKISTQQWMEILKTQPKERIEQRLKDVLEDIAFLESIYMTGGTRSHFTEQFKNSAYDERQALCQLSSVCYDLLRKQTSTAKE